MQLFARHEPAMLVPDALIVWTMHGIAFRLWSRFERRYEPARDEHLEKLWRRWLVIRWRPIGVHLYFV